jgi:hypothetical protein
VCACVTFKGESNLKFNAYKYNDYKYGLNSMRFKGNGMFARAAFKKVRTHTVTHAHIQTLRHTHAHAHAHAHARTHTHTHSLSLSLSLSLLSLSNVHTHTHTKINTHTNTHIHREFVLRSVNVGVLASLFTIGATPRPNGLGIQVSCPCWVQ